jgi:cell division protein FtsA
MSQKADNLIAVLDAGSAKTRFLIAELNDGALRYRGHGIVDSAGTRKGVIAELAPAVQPPRRKTAPTPPSSSASSP